MTRHECQRQALILQAQTLSVVDTIFDHPPLGVTIWSPATQTPTLLRGRPMALGTGVGFSSSCLH